MNYPRTHKEAMARPEADRWKVAEDIELSQLRKLRVAKLISLPLGARLLPSKWVYEVKRSGIYKVRFVARGDRQCPGRIMKRLLLWWCD